MPRRSNGPRLRLEPAEFDAAGRLTRHASWAIRDGGRKIRTGCRLGEAAEAERRLAAYIVAKHDPSRTRDRDPDQVRVAQLISVYADDVAVGHARPREAFARLERINAYFGAMRLSEITGASCRAYVASRGSSGGSRRELEDLRAACQHYHKEGLVTRAVAVWLPEKGRARERWLTRSEAARLLWAAWRLRQDWRGQPTKRRTAQHVARFILVALYTGTRAGAVCSAAIRPTIGRGYVDLETGIFFRRPAGERETKKRRPPMPLPDRLLAHLRRWEAKELSKATVVEWQGEPVKRISKAFRAVREAAGLGPDIVPHVLRHTACTWALRNGGEPFAVANLVGMSLDTLLRVYGHHCPDHLASVRNTITARSGPHNRPGSPELTEARAPLHRQKNGRSGRI